MYHIRYPVVASASFHGIFLSTNGQNWAPLAYRLDGDRYQVAAGAVRPGKYYLKLKVNDESHVRETPPVRIAIVRGERLP